MKTHMTITLAAVALLLGVHGLGAQTSKFAPSITRPRVNGTFTDRQSGQGVFAGTLEIARFEAQQNTVVASGTLAGTLADSHGSPIARIEQAGTLPVTRVTATCDMMRVELGPADVPMQAMPVHLGKDVIGITPRDGPPQMLQPLLCTSAHVLDGDPVPHAIAVALNEVFDAIRAPR